MIIDLTKFWKYVKEWSVGRLIVLLVLIAWIICCLKSLPCLNGKLLFSILLLSILLEIFQLSSHYNYELAKTKQERSVYVVSMIVALLGIIVFSIFCLIFFYSSI